MDLREEPEQHGKVGTLSRGFMLGVVLSTIVVLGFCFSIWFLPSTVVYGMWLAIVILGMLGNRFINGKFRPLDDHNDSPPVGRDHLN
jgi:putative Mn2+ efflux pump MntP